MASYIAVGGDEELRPLDDRLRKNAKGRVIRAAGGLLWKRGPEGRRIALIRRSTHGDTWSLPKGKLKRGESWLQGALREVEEETALRCALVEEVESTAHVDRKGRLKIVRYWIMLATAGDAVPQNEVDAVRWATLSRAAELLTYARDRRLLLGCRERCDRAATSSARQSIAGVARGT